MAVVYNDKSISIYIDGSLNNSGTLSTINDDSSSNVFMSFRRTKSNGAGLFNGSIDEVRYSTAVRSANWILTEYNNQNSPSTFHYFGNQEQWTC